MEIGENNVKKRNRISLGISIAVMSAAMLAGCDRGQGSGSQQTSTSVSATSADPDQAKKLALLNEISGVWNAEDNSGLWLLYYADNRFQSVLGDHFVPVTVGDVDVTNETVNLKLGGQSGESHIVTIRRIWDSSHTTFHLHTTLWDGSQTSLSFVRKVSADDLNRITQLASDSQPQSGQSTLASAVSAAQVPSSTPSAAVAAAPTSGTVQATSPGPAPDAAGATYETSFDCGTASTLAQYLICHDSTLAESDVDLEKPLELARTSARDQQAFADRIRKQWNYRESHCKDVACLTAWYQYENNVLTKIAQTGDANAQ